MQRKQKSSLIVQKFALCAAAATALLLSVAAQAPTRISPCAAETMCLSAALPVTLDGEGGTAQSRLFGTIPAADVQVTAFPADRVIPGGNALAVRLNGDGVTVVGFTDKEKSNPARKAGLRAGDVILRINGTDVRSADALSAETARLKDTSATLTYLRKNRTLQTEITPRADADGRYGLGILVRDTAAGIGTLTFVVPQTGEFGSLGHGITDPDTEELFRVGRGEVYPAQIVTVRKGTRGTPGELQGAFASPAVGTVSGNSVTGLYGRLDPSLFEGYATVPVAAKEDVHEGDAVIRCTLDGTDVGEYAVKIEHVYGVLSGPTKNLLIRVTDPVLLERTGGIVQGMSGSPILQDGKLIGAVTHVLVNDPAAGYGIFIENMLDSAEQLAA